MDPKQELIAAVRAVAARRGVWRLSLGAFLRETGIGWKRVYAHFESWPALCESAGLEPNPRKRRLAEAEVFADMHAVFLARGGPCALKDFLAEVPYSKGVLRRLFCSWMGALAAFRGWAVANAPHFPYLPALDARLDVFDSAAAARNRARPGPLWPAGGGRPCGDPIGFRALVFAPVNEQGVVLLFGMVAAELGYAVETVATGFPDCTARRRVAAGRWQSVRIEFEYRSRSFREHGHDTGGCDLIVCWEHDWPGCPLEVLALRPAIAALPARG